MVNEQKLSNYITKADEIEEKKFKKKIRVAILSSFTINGLDETLRVKCAEKNVFCHTFLGAYDQYAQEILNPNSDLFRFSPDILFLILDIRDILGDLFYFPYSISALERKNIVQNKINEIRYLSDVFTKQTKSKLVIANFKSPSFSPQGIFETKTEYGFHEMIVDLNDKLVKSFTDSNSVYIYDFHGFVCKYGENNTFDYKQFLFADIKISIEYIPKLAEDLMSFIIGYLGISKKCIVLDLDNTLWGGVAGEDGFNGILLGPEPPGNSYMEFQRVLLSFHQRGIILAINSKNNYDDALKIMKDHPYMVLREEHFASLKINWNDKISNLKEIANELNIGLDSLVFIDDDPVNREFTKSGLPDVLTIDLPADPSQYAATLKEMNEFSVLNITVEDIQRGKMYLEQRQRNELSENTMDLESFLKKLELKISIKNANEFTIPRISQLTLKTNQFNLTTKRYQEDEIRKYSEDPKYLVGCAQVQDKFGDNGITGVFIINKENSKEWYLDTFLLSCRVMGRDIEKGILGYIIKKAKDEHVEKIKAKFVPSEKNKPIEDFLPKCGFQKEGDYWFYLINSYYKIPDYIEVDIE